MSVLVIPNEAEDSGDAPARQEGRGESEVEAVEPPATGPLSPAQAEDAGADELSGQRSLQPGERHHISRHGGVDLARLHQLDHHLAAA